MKFLWKILVVWYLKYFHFNFHEYSRKIFEWGSTGWDEKWWFVPTRSVSSRTVWDIKNSIKKAVPTRSVPTRAFLKRTLSWFFALLSWIGRRRIHILIFGLSFLGRSPSNSCSLKRKTSQICHADFTPILT